MSASHLLVLPSIEDGFGLVLGQATACGCSVLASTNTGAPDLIREGVEGFIVPIRDPNILETRMQQLADEPQLQQRMSEAALARVISLGGWNPIWRSVGEAARSVVGKKAWTRSRLNRPRLDNRLWYSESARMSVFGVKAELTLDKAMI